MKYDISALVGVGEVLEIGGPSTKCITYKVIDKEQNVIRPQSLTGYTANVVNFKKRNT
nr:hypothetical protein [uncultured Macellibacteroides sp.]